MFGTVQGAVPGDCVSSSGGSHMGESGHTIGVDITVTIAVTMAIDSIGLTCSSNTGHAAVAHYASVDTHAVNIITGSGSAEQCSWSSQQFRLERRKMLNTHQSTHHHQM